MTNPARGRTPPSCPWIVERVRKERSQLYGAYFVLAATETEHGTTARVIRNMGMEPVSLAEAARIEIDLLTTPPS